MLSVLYTEIQLSFLWLILSVKLMFFDRDHLYIYIIHVLPLFRWVHGEYIKASLHGEGPTSANQNNRKLGVYDRKLEGSHSMFYCYLEEKRQ